MIEKIVSGGQSGVDRAALDVAIKLNIPHEGWCPRGRAAEDGIIPDKYQLKTPEDDAEEKESNIYNERTKLNIRDSDGTIILIPKIPLPETITDGTKLTIEEAKAKNKPYLVIDLSKIQDSELVIRWVEKNKIKTLNVGGPRESQSPGIYNQSLKFVEKILLALLTAKNDCSFQSEQRNNFCIPV